jgi:hypothetical protein
MDAAALRLALLVGVTLGYAAVLGRMIAAGQMLRFPVFWSLLFVSVLKSTTWAYGAMSNWTPFEPLLIGLKTLAAIEAFWLATRSLPAGTRRRLFLALLVAAGIGVALASRMDQETPGRSWVRTRQIAHVGLASFALAGCLWWWARLNRAAVDQRTLRHALILTTWLVAYAASGAIDYQAGATEARRWTLYYAQGVLFRVPTACCLWAWWRVMRRE